MPETSSFNNKRLRSNKLPLPVALVVSFYLNVTNIYFFVYVRKNTGHIYMYINIVVAVVAVAVEDEDNNRQLSP